MKRHDPTDPSPEEAYADALDLFDLAETTACSELRLGLDPSGSKAKHRATRSHNASMVQWGRRRLSLRYPGMWREGVRVLLLREVTMGATVRLHFS